MFERVVHPGLELRPRGRRAGRIIGRTQINDVNVAFGRFGHEPVAGTAGKINQFRVRARFVGRACMAGHDVRVHIDRIHRIADGDFVFAAQDVEDVAGVALRSIADKNFVVRHLDAAIAEVVSGNRRAQPFVALFGAVAVKSLPVAHFVHRLVHRRDDRRRQRLGHIADATTDEPLCGFRVRLAKHFYAPADLWKKITRFQFQVVIVQVSHFNRQRYVVSGLLQGRTKFKARTVAEGRH